MKKILIIIVLIVIIGVIFFVTGETCGNWLQGDRRFCPPMFTCKSLTKVLDAGSSCVFDPQQYFYKLPIRLKLIGIL